LSSTALAKKLGISRQHVDNIEYGRSNLIQNNDLTERLAEALELDVSVLKAVCPKRKFGSGRKIGSEKNYSPTPLGILIRAKRQGKWLSQEELAGLAGICTLTIVRIETGKILPRYDTLQKLMHALEIDPSELPLL
jgi:transcriptional regulator with XRE-family HTH domain